MLCNVEGMMPWEMQQGVDLSRAAVKVSDAPLAKPAAVPWSRDCHHPWQLRTRGELEL